MTLPPIDLAPAPPPPDRARVGRIVRPVDFQRVLAVAPRSRSAHFAAHHLQALPSQPARPARAIAGQPGEDKLSTGDAPSCPPPVDECPGAAAEPLPTGLWLGLVVPKRHARRSVTRSLLKRQMRTLMQQHAPDLAPGLWVLRLKAPFDRQLFGSAASVPLRQAARSELLALFERARVSRGRP